MTPKSKSQRRLRSVLKHAIPVFFVAILMCVDAFALDATATKSAVTSFKTIAVSVTIPIAAIGLASLGISLFSGNEKKSEEAMTRAKYCLTAVACVAILALAIRIGSGLGKTYAWDPSAPSSNNVGIPLSGDDADFMDHLGETTETSAEEEEGADE